MGFACKAPVKGDKISFAVIGDPKRRVIGQFGVISPRAPIAWASVFLVANDGKVAWRAIETVSGRVTRQQVLKAADQYLAKVSRATELADPISAE